MYTREELEKRIFTENKEEWIEAALKDYRSKDEAKIQAIENGIILPLERIIGTEYYAGGVYDENFNFVAGFKRDLEKPAIGLDEQNPAAYRGGG